MRAAAIKLRGFRNLDEQSAHFADRLTVVHGPNGSGKSNLLEAVFFGLTGVSSRTRRLRELIGFGQELTRVEVSITDRSAGNHRRLIAAAISRSEGRIHTLDGRSVRLEDSFERPAVSAFMPDRLELVKGTPSLRRAHIDSFAIALFPARTDVRQRYGAALAQRNALLGRIKAGYASATTLDSWDAELARCALELRELRCLAVDSLVESFGEATARLGLVGRATISYRPRVGEGDFDALYGELATRRDADLRRGHTTYGPHLDELKLELDGRLLRSYGSQGQQRIGLLALLLAERMALRAARGRLPLMLLDDVMSELDQARRTLLVDELKSGGQAILTTTEPSQVPGVEYGLAVDAGRVVASG